MTLEIGELNFLIMCAIHSSNMWMVCSLRDCGEAENTKNTGLIQGERFILTRSRCIYSVCVCVCVFGYILIFSPSSSHWDETDQTINHLNWLRLIWNDLTCALVCVFQCDQTWVQRNSCDSFRKRGPVRSAWTNPSPWSSSPVATWSSAATARPVCTTAPYAGQSSGAVCEHSCHEAQTRSFTATDWCTTMSSARIVLHSGYIVKKYSANVINSFQISICALTQRHIAWYLAIH